ncbi:hypothetical protein TrVE_jg4, partial [Triparma verrucosa]
GTKVEARYRGKAKYYPGKISRVRSNGTYDVAYDDGEKEFGVKREMIKVLESSSRSRSRGRDDSDAGDGIVEGDKVEARYRGKSKWYAGKVARVRSNGTMDIHYDDGERELGVDPSFVRAIKKSSSRSPRGRRDDSETEDGDLEVGSKVEARYRGKSKYYPGKISRVRSNGTYDINYDDGEKELGVKKELIKAVGGSSSRSRSRGKSSGPKVGQKCTAQFKGKGKFYPGKIAKVNSDGSVNVDFDDGDKDRFVDMACVKLEDGGGSDSEVDSDAALKDGTKVEARYRGKAKYYPGKINRVRSNGTYDINYDDGEKEFGVKREMIKVLESSSRSRSRGRDDSDAGDGIGEGDKVEARYRGKMKWYAGKVARVRSNGTMDIHYDDGE